MRNVALAKDLIFYFILFQLKFILNQVMKMFFYSFSFNYNKDHPGDDA